LGRTSGRATRPECIYSQGVHFEPKAGGEVRIFGFYNNKQTNKKTNKQDPTSSFERRDLRTKKIHQKNCKQYGIFFDRVDFQQKKKVIFSSCSHFWLGCCVSTSRVHLSPSCARVHAPRFSKTGMDTTTVRSCFETHFCLFFKKKLETYQIQNLTGKTRLRIVESQIDKFNTILK